MRAKVGVCERERESARGWAGVRGRGQACVHLVLLRLRVVGLVHVRGELRELLLAVTDELLRLGQPALALGDGGVVRLDLCRPHARV